MMRQLRRVLLLLAAMAAFGVASATTELTAQQPPASVERLTARGPGAAQPQQSGFYAWVMAKQGDYNQRLAKTIREIRTEPFTATLLLAALSFAYGIVHAAGPGHGKAVISSYVLANNQTVRRGIALSFLSSLFQALSAILLFGILVFVLKATGVTRKATEAWLETISWGLIVALGAWLLYGQVRKLLADRQLAAAHAGHAHAEGHGHHDHDEHAHAYAHSNADHGHGHGHGHKHDHGHSRGTHAHGHFHGHDHHDHSECCGHAHMPDPKQLEGDWSWTRALSLALAVGIRPCTGAIFVLGFALSQGLLWAGIFATFAMALGTAITVSTLAALAVGSRELAERLGGAGNAPWVANVRTVAGIGGALAVLGFGLTLFIGSLGQQSAF